MNCSEGNLHSCLSKPQIMPEIITENQVTPFSVVIPMAFMLGYIMGRVDKTTLVEDCFNRLHKILNAVKRILCSRLRIHALESKLDGWVTNQEAQKLRKPLQPLQRTVTCRCSRGETRVFEWLTRGLRALHMLETPEKEHIDDNSDSLTPPPISPHSESDESSSASRVSSVCTPCSMIQSPSFSGRMSPLLVGSKRGSFSSADSPRSPYNKSPMIISSRRLELDLEGMIEDHRSVDKSTSPMPLERSLLSPQRAELARAKLKAVIVQDNGSLDGRFPAAAWICGKDASLFQLKDGFGWLDLVESSLQCVYGEGWKAGVHPDDLPNCMEVINLANNGKGPFQIEYRLKVSQDEYRWVMDVVKARFSSAANFLGFVGWRVDTHDRKIIESNYWKYWLLPHEFLTEWSADGKYFTKVSPAFPSFLGYEMEEFKSIPWLEFIHPDDRKSTEDEFVKLRDGKPIVSLINRIRCKPGFKVDGANYMDATGIYKWLNWTASDVFSACRDISEDRLAHEELRSSKEELQRIADIIPGGIFLYRIDTNKEGSFPYVSKGAASLLGCHDGPENHVVQNLEDDGNFQCSRKGKAFGHNVHPDDWPRLEEAMHHAAVTTNPLDHDYRVVKDGEIRWVRVHSVPKTGPNGSTDWYGITWDMTKQHQAVDALREARDNAEKAALAKGNFLAHMSHEIRTPMNAVIGMGALLLETDLTDEQRDYVVTIRNSGEALLSIINDILDYSKIEAGKMERETVPLDIVQLIRESFDLVVPQAAAKGLEITYTVSEAVPRIVLGDYARVRQVLVNLLTNAVKFTERGGISVSVDGHKCPPEVQNGRENGTNGKAKAVDTDSVKTMWELKFSVKDSGIGIPDDRRSRLFQAFSQVDASTTRRFGGTGLGLAICARLTALHGGRIWWNRMIQQSWSAWSYAIPHRPKFARFCLCHMEGDQMSMMMFWLHC